MSVKSNHLNNRFHHYSKRKEKRHACNRTHVRTSLDGIDAALVKINGSGTETDVKADGNDHAAHW